jgi:hypothetical protein
MPQHVSDGSWPSGLAVLPAVAAALLPRLTCPCTLPAYAGLLSSMGLAVLLETAYLLPLTLVTLLVALGTLVFRARRRRGYAPFFLGLGAAVLIVVGNYALASDPMTYSGIGVLVAASAWNAWPRHARL